jgi:hypothetical protein
MKKVGVGLLFLATLVTIGGVIWMMVSEAGNTPVIIFVIVGAFALGFLVILAGVIRDRIKQKKNENFKEVKY